MDGQGLHRPFPSAPTCCQRGPSPREQVQRSRALQPFPRTKQAGWSKEHLPGLAPGLRGWGGWGGIPRGGSRAQAMSASSSPVPPWHQPGWHWVQRAWESRVEEALVPSKILPARGCDAWAEGGKGCEEIQAAPSKKAPSQRCSPPAKVFSRSAPCSREVSVWDHSRAALALAPLKAAAAGGAPGVASLSYCRPPHFTEGRSVCWLASVRFDIITAPAGVPWSCIPDGPGGSDGGAPSHGKNRYPFHTRFFSPARSPGLGFRAGLAVPALSCASFLTRLPKLNTKRFSESGDES